MLSTPHDGYTAMTINGVHIGSASYVEDVPVVLMKYFMDALGDGGSCHHMNIHLDAEGYAIGLIDFNEYLYAVADDGDVGLSSTRIMPYDGRATHQALAKELVRDIRGDMHDWVLWDPVVSFDDEGNEVSHDTPAMDERRRFLQSMATRLESML